MATRLRPADRLETLLDDLDPLANALSEEIRPQASPLDTEQLSRLLGRLVSRFSEIRRQLRALRREPDAETDHKKLIKRTRLAISAERVVSTRINALLQRARTAQTRVRGATIDEPVTIGIFNAAFSALERVASGPDRALENAGDSHAFIPLKPDQFISLLHFAWRLLATLNRLDNARFLDVGCGAGAKLFIARQFFPIIHGIELEETYVERSQFFFSEGAGDIQIERADALEYSMYGDFDVVYYYIPLRNHELQRRLEAKIWSDVRPGTIVLAPRISPKLFMDEIPAAGREVWIKGVEGDDLAQLVAEAALFGPAMPEDLAVRDRGRGVLAGPLAALRLRGYC